MADIVKFKIIEPHKALKLDSRERFKGLNQFTSRSSNSCVHLNRKSRHSKIETFFRLPNF